MHCALLAFSHLLPQGDTVKLLVGANTPSGPDEFTAQRALLAKRSEYFCALVNSGMQDAGAAVLEFPGWSRGSYLGREVYTTLIIL